MRFPDASRTHLVLMTMIILLIIWMAILSYSIVRINHQTREVCRMAFALEDYYQDNIATFRRRDTPTADDLIRNTQQILDSIDNLNC